MLNYKFSTLGCFYEKNSKIRQSPPTSTCNIRNNNIFSFLLENSLFWKIQHQLLPAYNNIEYDNHQIDINTRNKKLYFGHRYNGQYIEHSFFEKSVLIWNKLTDDKVNFKDILTYRKAKVKFKNYYLLLFKEDSSDHFPFYSFLLIYNPPQTSLFRVDSSVLVEAMFNHRDEVVKCLGRKVMKDRVVTAVLGDINLPDVCWSSHTATSDYSNKFLTALEDLDLLQIVDFSTLVSGNILDLLCVSDPHRFIVFRGATAFSDHFPVYAHVFAASSISHFTTKRSVTYSKISLNSESFSRAISPCAIPPDDTV